ncbi:MAG: hypothetical protein HY730_02160 [Candidatus Tectomicrobia bacterium]|uniref:Uncharacterized protein n=1 Tax=Tectimicrobiota bacterium TaxID=2528274 RepID=A0A933GJT3_UNCTE|nr:hypothetical protein [Candidatus Tectomicrobia bacterium]
MRARNYAFLTVGGLAGILAITLHGLTDFNMQIPANAMMFFFLLGLTYRMMEFEGERKRGSWEERKLGRAEERKDETERRRGGESGRG